VILVEAWMRSFPPYSPKKHAAIGREGDVGRVDELAVSKAIGADRPADLAGGAEGDEAMLVGVGHDEQNRLGRPDAPTGLPRLKAGIRHSHIGLPARSKRCTRASLSMT
jgi:hypothetical protein